MKPLPRNNASWYELSRLYDKYTWAWGVALSMAEGNERASYFYSDVMVEINNFIEAMTDETN